MTSFSSTSLSPVEDGMHYGEMSNKTITTDSSTGGHEQNESVIWTLIVFLLCIWITGLVGNGMVIFLLGFRIKRSPFTTFILNLAVADFGVLLPGIIYLILRMTYTYTNFVVFVEFFHFPYVSSQLLLTAISVDRCVSVLFPIWHRCHRPPHLSTIVCALIWVINFLVSGSLLILWELEVFTSCIIDFSWFMACSVLCLPLVTVSTIILLFKVSCTVRHPRPGRLLTIVLLTLLFYLICGFPMNGMFTVYCFVDEISGIAVYYSYICAGLNSCVNPVIYYVVGRRKRGQERQGLKVVLQQAFKEEEEPREERGTTAQTQL